MCIKSRAAETIYGDGRTMLSRYVGLRAAGGQGIREASERSECSDDGEGSHNTK